MEVTVNNIPFEQPAPSLDEELEIPETTNMRTLSDATSGYASFLHTPDGTEITCADSFSEESVAAKDLRHSYPHGLTKFCITTTQLENQIKITFVTSLEPEQVVARKYNYVQEKYFDISDATIAKTTYQNKPALQVTYTIVDNGELDLDPEMGKIIDPIGLAVVDDDTSGGALASTGVGQHYLVATLFTTVSAVCIFIAHRMRRHYITKNT